MLQDENCKEDPECTWNDTVLEQPHGSGLFISSELYVSEYRAEHCTPAECKPHTQSCHVEELQINDSPSTFVRKEGI